MRVQEGGGRERNVHNGIVDVSEADFMENKIAISKSTAADIDRLMEIRLEMLRVVNGLEADYEFSDELKTESRGYFLSGDQTTLLATDGEKTIGCASINYITIMPTFSHPTGKRAFLMSVYTQKEYRRMGIARRMVGQLVGEARAKGCSEIILDATEEGRPLYKSLGFKESGETMCLQL